MGTVPRNLVAVAGVCLAIVACATGEGTDRFTDLNGAAPAADAGRDARRPADTKEEEGGEERDDERPSGPDAGGADASAVVTTGKVACGGYDYPEVVTVPAISCTGYVSGCTGAHVFRAVGCYTATPAGNPCPAGFKVASMMLVGQWAQAAEITRLLIGNRACMWSFGSSPMTSACGGDAAHYPYCWTKSGVCAGGGCSTQCCEGFPSGSQPCADSSGAEYPILCVQ